MVFSKLSAWRVALRFFPLPRQQIIGLGTVLLCILFAAVPDAKSQQAQSLPISPLLIETDNGVLKFNVELADEEHERRIGLMHRDSMADDHGMLFDMGAPVRASFWMKDTALPLDIIFIRTDGRIANIKHGTPYQIRPPVQSKGRVLGVLELNEGTAEKLGIKPGDLVRHTMFGNWQDKTVHNQ